MQDFKIFDELNKCKNYEIALMTTFNFDIGFFERSPLRIFESLDIKKINLFVDAGELSKSIEALPEGTGTSLGKKYLVSPVNINGSFHPKVILLLGQDSAKLFVSSANLTTNGFYINNEVFNLIEYSIDNPANIGVINSAIHFFETLNDYTTNKDKSLLNDVHSLIYYNQNSDADNIWFLESTEQSLLSQLENIVFNPEIINIAVPFYDNELAALDQLHEAFPKAKVNLFIQHSKSKCPIPLLKKKSYVNSIKGFYGFNDRESESFYHGKVFGFETPSESFVLYGSANCTKSAMTLTPNDNGNIECSILEKGNRGEFDYFFNNFEIKDSKKITCDLLSFNGVENKKYYFKYAHMNSNLILHLGYYTSTPIEIFLEDVQLQYEYRDDLLVTVPANLVSVLPNVFSITIRTESEKTIINCWYNNVQDIQLFRLAEKASNLHQFEYSSPDSAKYIQDRKNVLLATSLCFEDLLEEQRLLLRIEKSINPMDDEDVYEGEGIVSYEVPSISRADVIRYKDLQAISHIRQTYFSKLNEQSTKALSKFSAIKKVPKEHEVHPAAVNRREPTTEEEKFSRFVKRQIKGMLEEKFVENSSLEHYLFATSVFLDIFDKYTIGECVENVFDSDYLLTAKTNLLLNVITKYHEDSAEINSEYIIEQTIQSILSNNFAEHFSYDTDEVNAINKTLIIALDQAFNIRESFQQYLLAVLLNVATYSGSTINASAAERYVDSLFGFLPYSEIERQILLRLDPSAIMERTQEEFQVTFSSNSITQHKDACTQLIMEIERYCNYYSVPVKKIAIKICNTSSDMNKYQDPLVYIEYQKDMKTSRLNQIGCRESGKKEIECLQKSHLYRVENNEPLQNVNYSEGMHVCHKKYGEGIIKIVDREHDRLIVTFNEKDVPLGLSYAPRFLEKV